MLLSNHYSIFTDPRVDTGCVPPLRVLLTGIPTCNETDGHSYRHVNYIVYSLSILRGVRLVYQAT